MNIYFKATLNTEIINYGKKNSRTAAKRNRRIIRKKWRIQNDGTRQHF